MNNATTNSTIVTNLFSGFPARGMRNRLVDDIGPISDKVPAFPFAGKALEGFKGKREEFSYGFWAGQNINVRPTGGEGDDSKRLTEWFVEDTERVMREIFPSLSK